MVVPIACSGLLGVEIVISDAPASFLFEQFHDYLTFERGLSEQTVVSYGRDLNGWFSFVEEAGVTSPAEVDIGILRKWTYSLKGKGMAPRSIRRAQSAVRTYFRFLSMEAAVEVDPTDRLEPPRIDGSLPDVLSKLEIGKVLESPDSTHRLYWRDRAILEFLYATGVRVSELVSLRITSLELEEGFAKVFGKGSKERLVPVGGPALRSLKRYLRDLRPNLDQGNGAGLVFLNARGNPIRRKSVWAIVREAAIRAGIARAISPHTIRHTFATHLVEGGADLVTVQELLGHADISTTRIYTHLDRAYLREVHQKYHPRQ